MIRAVEIHGALIGQRFKLIGNVRSRLEAGPWVPLKRLVRPNRSAEFHHLKGSRAL